MIEGAAWRRWVFYNIPLILFVVVLLFPFYWMIITSFRPDGELYRPWNAVNSQPFLRAMKAADPSARIGVPWAFGQQVQGAGVPDGSQWNKAVLRSDGKDISFVDAHHYPFTFSGSTTGLSKGSTVTLQEQNTHGKWVSLHASTTVDRQSSYSINGTLGKGKQTLRTEVPEHNLVKITNAGK